MAQIQGLSGFRPNSSAVEYVTTPPYDVIKEGSALEAHLSEKRQSLFHVTLGADPKGALEKLLREEALVSDQEPCFYVYEQDWDGGQRVGFFAAVEASPYRNGQVVRHEKTFDEKVKGRIAVTNKTGLTLEPIFLLTRSPIGPVMNRIRETQQPLYDFRSDFSSLSELHGIRNRVFRVLQQSEEGKALMTLVAQNPLYIADGHHRYHAALLNGQTHAMAYIVEDARILAYNRVIRGKRSFSEVKTGLSLESVTEFRTPEKHSFHIYTREGAFRMKAREVPSDVVGRLDCSILEKELYPALGVDHSMILQKKHFDYYSESELEAMREKVDDGTYDLAVALHPVSLEELMAVADAGLRDTAVVMPEKSTFFAPKILSGLLLYEHQKA